MCSYIPRRDFNLYTTEHLYTLGCCICHTVRFLHLRAPFFTWWVGELITSLFVSVILLDCRLCWGVLKVRCSSRIFITGYNVFMKLFSSSRVSLGVSSLHRLSFTYLSSSVPLNTVLYLLSLHLALSLVIPLHSISLFPATSLHPIPLQELFRNTLSLTQPRSSPVPVTLVHLYLLPGGTSHWLTRHSLLTTAHKGYKGCYFIHYQSSARPLVWCGGQCKQTVTSRADEPITAGDWCWSRFLFYYFCLETFDRRLQCPCSVLMSWVMCFGKKVLKVFREHSVSWLAILVHLTFHQCIDLHVSKRPKYTR